jgi:hypothetical protein
MDHAVELHDRIVAAAYKKRGYTGRKQPRRRASRT